MTVKIAMIGAGSIGFTRTLLRDILSVPELADTTFAFTDISERNLDMVAQLCRREIAASKLPATITATTDRRAAIADSDYVISTIRQGGLAAFQTDIDIPLKYGVDQCVGDTLSAGGIMYAQRTIPALLDFCKDIREVAKSDALFLNYSNPMAMNVWACNTYGGVRTIGLCHGVQGAHWQITRCIELWAKREGLLKEDEELHRRDVDVVAAGINHQTWFIKVQWRGMDMLPRLLELFEAHPTYRETEKVRIDVLRRFGYYSTESNGHLSEYLPWYRKRVEEIPQWIDLSSWINGETGGYLRVCTEGRNWFETDFPNWLKEEPQPISPARRSEEHGSYIIEALETGRVYRGHFNVVNQNHITNLPNGCVIEIPGYVDKNGINMPVVGKLPLACAATCSASVRVQEMGMEAAVHGEVTLLKQAMLHDPLIGAVCNPEEVWQMTDEMLIAQGQWLPQYQSELAGAKERLEQSERNGTRVKLVQTEGAARLHTRTVEEMASNQAEARANTAAADKGKMTKVS
ncbi:alpha-glucosidase/alpha-galactosidase [Reticulibacter mediterranei]|uniref:Alpha-glucosidase/alpha-galactosidase n=1 Tax=Reticulibacter mediterranei TaxID=2778369 RepID=A0A8J3INP6_9CHLR|nr:alpha-glucosidase/alpha-galactosidase [Reticulibacter mediterranei]GHO99044.1 alpha-glucosidase/alpha-galactosidase [Reticulibacter mediterranei]